MRLIDADALTEMFQNTDADGMNLALDRYAIKCIDNAPTIDAVEVVRCKDCKWFGEYGCAIRIVDDSDKPKENDYCSFAERRSDETD